VVDLDFNARVDDAILCAASRLARLREQTLRAGVRDFQASCVEMAADDPDDIWRLRKDRCGGLLMREDDELRKMARSALLREKS